MHRFKKKKGIFHAWLFNVVIFDDEPPRKDMIYLNLRELSSEELDNYGISPIFASSVYLISKL